MSKRKLKDEISEKATKKICKIEIEKRKGTWKHSVIKSKLNKLVKDSSLKKLICEFFVPKISRICVKGSLLFNLVVTSLLNEYENGEIENIPEINQSFIYKCFSFVKKKSSNSRKDYSIIRKYLDRNEFDEKLFFEDDCENLGMNINEHTKQFLRVFLIIFEFISKKDYTGGLDFILRRKKPMMFSS